MSILVFGHKNPDTDTICSAIAYAELKNKLGKDVKAVRLGEVNEETKYALKYFKVEKPELVENVAGKELAEIAGVDLKEYGLEMLKAGTALGDKSEAELLNMDMKIFEIDGEKIGVAQVNTVNEAEVLERKEKLLAEIDNIIAKEGLKFFMLAITNILTNDSTALVSGNGNDVIEKAFGEKVDSNLVTLKGVVSRKKQIIPPLTKAIQG